MCLREVPPELAKEGSQSWHRSIPHCLMSLPVLEKRNHCFVCSFEQKCSERYHGLEEVCEPPVSHPGCHRKKWGHRQFSVSSSLWTHESAITGPKNLWSLWSHLLCQEIKPTRAKLPSPRTFQLVEVFCYSVWSIITSTNDLVEPIGGTLKLDLPSYLTTPHFCSLLISCIYQLWSQTWFWAEYRLFNDQIGKKIPLYFSMIMWIIPTQVYIFLWSTRHTRCENSCQLQLPHWT